MSVVAHKFVVLRHRKKKYRCPCGGCLQTAPGPYKLTPEGRYADAFAIQVAVDKYQDHLPLHRQAMRMKRMGLEVSSHSLWDQIEALSKALEPAYHRLGEHLRGAPVLFVDETPWRLLQKGKSKKWQVWSMSSAEGVYYHIDPSRSAQGAKTLLGDFQGVVMCDGYSAYKTLKKENQAPLDPGQNRKRQAQAPPSYTLAHCWAHVRRKFFELQSVDTHASDHAMGLIAQLYKVDKQLRAQYRPHPEDWTLPSDEDPRKPILEELKQWALSLCASPNSPTAKSRDYMLKHWQGLTLHLNHPSAPLDNNQAECALRKVVIGTKNHYGSKSLRGTQVAAQLYSLIESAHQQGLDPSKYLTTAVQAYHLNDPIPLPHQIVSQKENPYNTNDETTCSLTGTSVSFDKF